jgi:hypothetical protein
MGFVSVTVVVAVTGAEGLDWLLPGDADGTVPAHAPRVRPASTAKEAATIRLLIVTSPSLETLSAQDNRLY